MKIENFNKTKMCFLKKINIKKPLFRIRKVRRFK